MLNNLIKLHLIFENVLLINLSSHLHRTNHQSMQCAIHVKYCSFFGEKLLLHLQTCFPFIHTITKCSSEKGVIHFLLDCSENKLVKMSSEVRPSI